MPKDHFASFEDQVRLKQEAERKEKERIHHELERERREKGCTGEGSVASKHSSQREGDLNDHEGRP